MIDKSEHTKLGLDSRYLTLSYEYDTQMMTDIMSLAAFFFFQFLKKIN